VKRSFQVVALIFALTALLSLAGCKKKKPPVPQAGAQAPMVTQPTPTPEPTPTPQPEVQPEKQPEKPAEAATTKPKSKPKHTTASKKPAAPSPQAAPARPEEKPQQQASARPPRIVIQEGGASESRGEITAGTGHDEATHRRLTTQQLLDGTESNLRSIKRTLTAEEQSMVAQIKDYMEQSRIATAEDDLVRAHNLALKAHLLSDELVKH